MTQHSRVSGLPLSGVRVLDLSTVFMAPYAAQLLGEWGAEVVKVEAPGGDPVRHISDPGGQGLGPVFLNANRSKRAVTVDLKSRGGQQVLSSLVRESDVFLHNVRPTAARRLGITAEPLLETNPRLVHATFRGYGAGGEYADRPAYDDVIQASTGVADAQAAAGGEPGYWRSAVADKVMGLYGAGAISAALHARAVTGSGRGIEIPMFEGMASFMLLDRQGGWVHDPPSGPAGYPRTDSPYRKPYRTADGYLSVMVYTDRQWAAFFSVVGRPELAEDPRFATLGARTQHTDELYGLVEEELSRRPTREWRALLEEADLPHGPVNRMEDLFEDPHLERSGFFSRVEQPGVGAVRYARSPLDLGADPRVPGPAPRPGEHTREVLREHGWAAEEIDRLVDEGAIRAGADGVEQARVGR